MPKARAVNQESPAAGPVTVTVAAVQTPQPEKPKEPIEFWSYIQALTPQQWRDHTVYLYRTRPVVGINQREKYLCIYQQPFTIEDVKKTYGGEEFRAILNRYGKMIKETTFGVEAAPIYDRARETPSHGDASNAAMERTVDKLVDRADPRALVSNATDMLMSAHRTSLEMIQKTSNGEGSDMLKLVLAMMQNQTTLMTTLITAMIKQPAHEPAPADPTRQLESMMTIFGRLKEFAGDNAGGRTSVWETIGEKAVDKLPEILGGIKQIWQQRTEFERARRVPAPVQAQPAAAPVPAPIQAAVPQQPAPAAAEHPPMPVMSENEVFEKLAARRVVQLIFSGAPGDVIVQFIRGANEKLYDIMLEANAEQLKAAMGMDPILAQALQYPQLDELLKEIAEVCAEDKADMIAAEHEEAGVTV